MSRASGEPRGFGRRRFLRRTLLGAGLLAIAGTVLRHLSGYPLERGLASRLTALSPKEYLVLRAVCERLLAPDERGAPAPDQVDAVLAIDRYLAGLPEALRSDVRALLQLLEHGPPLFSLRASRFTRLDGDSQDRELAGWAASVLDVRRQGFQALKSLAMLGYYGDPRSFAIPDYPGPMLPPRGP